MIHDPLYLAQVFGFLINFSIGLFGIWGFWFVLARLMAPLLKAVLHGYRRF